MAETPFQLPKNQARVVLAQAVQEAERRIMSMVKQKRAQLSNDPYVALTGLVVHTGMVIQNHQDGRTEMSMEEILKLQHFVVYCEEYTPSTDFPFTKEQMRQALEKAGENGEAEDSS